MNPELHLWFALVLLALTSSLLALAIWCVRALCEESRRWHRLAQLALEQLLKKDLSIDEHPGAPAESSVHVPDDLRRDMGMDEEDEDEE